MHYIVTGSLGHISKPLAQKLIAAGHRVTIISSNTDRRKAIESIGATPAIGSVEDVAFLPSTFKGADAVYTMIPPTMAVTDWKKHIASVGKSFAQAIRSAGVKYVVNLSSIGAHMPEGCGPVSGLHFAEAALNELSDTNVLHLRPGFFYINLLAQVGLAKNMGILGGNYGQGGKIIFAHTNDIAEVAARALLQLGFKGKSYEYIVSDETTTDEVAKTLGPGIKKPELAWVNFNDEQNFGGLVQAGLPEELARNYTEMGGAMRSGEMYADYVKLKGRPVGSVKLKDFAREFAAVYNQ